MYIFDVSGRPGCLSSGKREEFDPDGNQGLQQERPKGPHCLPDPGQKGHGMLKTFFSKCVDYHKQIFKDVQN